MDLWDGMLGLSSSSGAATGAKTMILIKTSIPVRSLQVSHSTRRAAISATSTQPATMKKMEMLKTRSKVETRTR